MNRSGKPGRLHRTHHACRTALAQARATIAASPGSDSCPTFSFDAVRRPVCAVPAAPKPPMPAHTSAHESCIPVEMPAIRRQNRRKYRCWVQNPIVRCHPFCAGAASHDNFDPW